jgi:hypothetical protein
MLERVIDSAWGPLEAAVDADGGLRFDIPDGRTLTIRGELGGEVWAEIDGHFAGRIRPLTEDELAEANERLGLADASDEP